MLRASTINSLSIWLCFKLQERCTQGESRIWSRWIKRWKGHLWWPNPHLRVLKEKKDAFYVIFEILRPLKSIETGPAKGDGNIFPFLIKAFALPLPLAPSSFLYKGSLEDQCALFAPHLHNIFACPCFLPFWYPDCTTGGEGREGSGNPIWICTCYLQQSSLESVAEMYQQCTHTLKYG